MKLKKEITTLDTQKHGVKFPAFAEQNEFDKFSRQLRAIVLANLPALTSGETYEAERSWDFDETTQEFFFTFSTAIHVEVIAALPEHSTKTASVHATFSFDPLLADLITVIGALDSRIAAFKSGLLQMRKLQLQNILTTEGREAYDAACRRSI